MADSHATTTTAPEGAAKDGNGPLPLSPRTAFFRQYAWLPFLAPLIVNMVAPMLFDTSAPAIT